MDNLVDMYFISNKELKKTIGAKELNISFQNIEEGKVVLVDHLTLIDKELGLYTIDTSNMGDAILNIKLRKKGRLYSATIGSLDEIFKNIGDLHSLRLNKNDLTIIPEYKIVDYHGKMVNREPIGGGTYKIHLTGLHYTMKKGELL